MKAKILSICMFGFALAAAIVSQKLVLKHILGESGSEWFDAGCSDDPEAGSANCGAVLSSPYAYIPPKHPGSKGWHIPAATIGLTYYTTLAIWVLGIGIPSRRRAWLHVFPTVLVGAGLIGSVYFIWVMYTKLPNRCPWCLVTHALNGGIAACVGLMWKVALAKAEIPVNSTDKGGKSKKEAEAKEPAHLVRAPTPSFRAIVMTIVAIVGVNYGHASVVSAKIYEKTAASYKKSYDAFMKRITNAPEALVELWKSEPKVDLTIRPDDPAKRFSPEEPLAQMVIFSDFECPSCQRFAGVLDSRIAPIFQGRLRVVFKHYPIDQTCNPVTTATLHPHACEAAKWAEGARMLGGNEAFWKADEFFIHNREQLAMGELNIDLFAKAIGVEAGKLRKAAASPEVERRITEDAELAKKIGVVGTPAVYVNGRVVDQFSKGNTLFWQALSEYFVMSATSP